MHTDGEKYRSGMPFRALTELEQMRRRFDEEFTRPIMRAVWDRVPEEMKEWAPALDVYDKGDDFVVEMEIAGVKMEDIDVSVSENTLVIKGERKPEAGIKNEDFHRAEIMRGGFHRSIMLPSSVDNKNSEAIYENGILRITLHRSEEAKPKKVNIRVKGKTA